MDSHLLSRGSLAAIAACAALLAAGPAQAETPLGAAEQKALDALGVEESDAPVLVLRQRKPLRAGTVVRQAGPVKPGVGRATKLGVRRAKAPVALTVGRRERAWMFYADEAPFQAYQHPGRIVLVGVESGKVATSKTMQWPPAIRGKLPPYMRSAAAYRDPANRIFYRFWGADPMKIAARRGQGGKRRSLGDDRFGAAAQSPAEMALRQRAANKLAAERSCVVRFGETLGNFYDFASIDRTVVGFGGLFNGLERLNSGFRSSRYGVKSGRSPLAYVQRAIDRGNCRDVLLYLAGSGYKGKNVVNFGLRPRADGTVEVHEVSARQLRRFARRNAGVTFKLITDSPYAGGFANLVTGEPNVLIAQTPGQSTQPSFRYIPGILDQGKVLRNLGNSMGLLEFTNQLRIGFNRFLSSKAELDHAEAQGAGRTAGRRFLADGDSSYLVWAMGRSFDLSQDADFAGLIGLTNAINRMNDSERPTAPPGGNPNVNRAPVATPQSVDAAEDASEAITLAGTDPDGGTIAYEVVGPPAHGDLSGSAPNLTYTPDANFNGADSFTFRVSDGALTSAPATVSIDVSAVNDNPVLDATNAALPYVEGDGAIPVDPALTVTDADDAQMSGATVQITGNHASAEDELAFANAAGITGAWDDASGKLTLSGPASQADYQAALRAVTYENGSAAPSTAARTVTFTVSDASGGTSAADTRNVTVVPKNNLATVTTSPGSASFTEDGAAAVVDDNLTVGDPDDTQLEGAIVAISTNLQTGDALVFVDQLGITHAYNSGTGVLTLTGTASKSDYQAALRSVEFDTTSQDPAATKTIQFRADDGNGPGPVATRDVALNSVNDAPVVELTNAPLAYAEGAGPVAIDTAVTVSDAEAHQISGASVDVSDATWFAGQDELTWADNNAGDGITLGSDDDATGTLSLTGNGTAAQYEAALEAIRYTNDDDNPDTTSRVLSATVTDAPGATSAADTRNIDVSRVNDAPVLSNAGTLNYTENGAATAVSSTLTVADADDTNFESASVSITSGHESSDDLSWTDNDAGDGIALGSDDNTTDVLTLTGTGTLVEYQAALRAVKYDSSSHHPGTAKQATFTANDGDTASNGAIADIAVTRVNDAPQVSLTDLALAYAEGDGAVAIDTVVGITDFESDQLSGATIDMLDAAWFPAEDELTWTDNDGADSITLGSDDDTTGTLTLTGTGSLAQYESAIEAIRYTNSSDNPDTTTRELSATVTDVPGATSAPEPRNIDVSRVNDAPVVTTSAGSTSYTEGGSATVDGGLTVADADDTSLEAGQVRISANFEPGDALTFANQNGISGNYNSGTGVLTLTGTASKADYQTALRSIEFQTAHDDPATSRTVEFRLNDGDVDSNLATKDVSVTRVNDKPTVNTTGSPRSYTEGDGAMAVDTGLTLTDPDSTHVQGATVEISGSFVPASDELAFATQNGITGAYDDTTGTLTLSGTTSVANYQTALRSVTYENSSDNPSGSKTVSFRATDAEGATSDAANRTIDLTGANDAPVLANGGTLNYTENDAPTQVTSTLTVSDVDDTNLESASAAVTSGHQTSDDLSWTDNDAGDGITLGSDDNTNDVLTLTGTGTLAAYQAALRAVKYENTGHNPTGPKQVTFIGNDGNTDSNGAIADINITGQNDAPLVNLTDANMTYNEGAGAVAIDPGATVDDADDGAVINRVTVEVTSNWTPAQDELAWVDNNGADGITGTANDSLGTLTLEGDGTEAQYEAALRAVTYENNSDAPAPATRVVSATARDSLGATGPADTRTIDLAGANDAPVVATSSGSTAYTEDAPAVAIDGGVTVSDVDDASLEGGRVRISAGFQSGDELVFSNQNGITGNYTTATGVLTLTGNASKADYETALRSVEFRTSNGDPSKTVEFKVNDGDADSNLATKEIAITNSNDAPVNTVPGTQTLDEDASKTFSSGNGNHISVSDPDAGTDPLKVTLAVNNGTLTLNGTTGLDFACGGCAGDGTSDQTMAFTGSQTDLNAALNGLIYVPSSNFNGADTLTITSNDQGATGAGGTQSDTDTVGLTVSAVNDAPTNTVPGGQQVDEDTALTFSSGNGNAISTADPDAGGGDVRVTLDVDHGTLTLATTTGLNFACAGCAGDGTNDATMVFEGTVAEANAARNGMSYQGASNYNGSDTLTITTNDLGNTGSGGALSDTDTVAITVNPVNDSPSADAETFGGAGNLNDQAHGNTTMQVDDPSDDKSAPTNPHTEIAGDILDGDTDPDGPGPMIVQSAGSDAGATNGQTADGGTITVESDGDFVYQPPASVSCDNGTDSFNYKISDQANSGGGPIPGVAIGTVTIHLEGCVWYVNNNAAGNAGTAIQPFDTAAQAETASGANHTVFVFDGDNTATGYQTGFAMNSGERLIGEHEGLTVDQDQGGAMTADSLHPANPGAHPTLQGTNEDVVELDDGNEVRGFNLNPTGTGSGIAGSSGDTGGATIDDVNVIDSSTAGSQPGIELDSTTGTFNLSNIVVNNQAAVSPPSTATGVRLNNAGTVNFNPTGQISIGINGAKGLDAIGTNMGTSTFDNITVAGSSAGGVNLTSTTGTTTFGDGTGIDLDLTTTSGSTGAFVVSNGGTVNVASAGTDDLHATGGPAVDVTGTSGATLEFDDVDSTNSANDGINLDGLGTGTFSATSGDIGGAAGIGFDLNGGSGAITYPGNLNNGSGPLVAEVTGRSGGAVTLSGPISDTNDAGGGLNVASNTGGSTTLSNATKQFNTGTSAAVSFTSSDGHTLVLSGGGLDIDTTSGNGLNATTAGTIEVSGSANTIDATALGAGNRGINVSDTDFAAADMTFQRVSTSGGPSAIRLNNTGTTGNLNVSGNGANDSGGTIQNTTGNAVDLTNTDNFTADEMNIQNPARDGFSGFGVTNFTVTDSTIHNAGQSDVDITDSAFAFNTTSSANENNIDGVVTIARNTITNPYGGGVDIFNHSGTISDLNISNNTLTSGTLVGAVAGTGDADSVEDAIQVVTFGGTGFAASLTKGLVDGNNITGFPDGTGIEFLGGSQGTTEGFMGTRGNATNKVVISNNLIRGHSSAIPMGQNAIVADVEGRGGGHFEILNNGSAGSPIANVLGSAILAGNAGDADAEFEITGNRADLDTSIAGSSGIGIGTDKDTIADASVLSDPDIDVNLSNNFVTDSAGSAIRILHRDSNGTANVKVQNNEARSRPNNGTPGISVNNGSSGDDAFDPTMCSVISSNVAEGAVDGFGDKRPGIELFKRIGATDSNGSYTFGIQGLSPSPATGTQAEDYVALQNPGSVTGNSSDGSGFFNKRAKVRSGNHFESCTVPAF